jgi:hypothetical protein
VLLLLLPQRPQTLTARLLRRTCAAAGLLAAEVLAAAAVARLLLVLPWTCRLAAASGRER